MSFTGSSCVVVDILADEVSAVDSALFLLRSGDDARVVKKRYTENRER